MKLLKIIASTFFLIPLPALAFEIINNPLSGIPQGLEGPGFLWGRFAIMMSLLIGVLFFVAITYGGFLWVTSSGESEKVDKGLKIILWAVIGIIVLFSAYAIVDFYFSLVGGDTSTSAVGTIQFQ